MRGAHEHGMQRCRGGGAPLPRCCFLSPALTAASACAYGLTHARTRAHTPLLRAEGERPVFKITPSDDPKNPEVGQTASGAWSAVMKRVNNNRQRQVRLGGGRGSCLYCRMLVRRRERVVVTYRIFKCLSWATGRLGLAQGVVESKTAVSGPEYYGLAYPEIKRLIQDLPNATLCATKPMGRGCYKWQVSSSHARTHARTHTSKGAQEFTQR